MPFQSNPANLLIGSFILTLLFVLSSSFLPKTEIDAKSDFFEISDGLFISKYEISNVEYKQFLKEASRKSEKLYEVCMVNNNGWNEHDMLSEYRDYNEDNPSPHARNYFSNEHYDDFPVVNITVQAAKKYCQWLTTQANKGANKKFVYRLPTMDEFKRAVEMIQPACHADHAADYKDQFPCNMKYKFVDEQGKLRDNLGVDNWTTLAPVKPTVLKVNAVNAKHKIAGDNFPFVGDSGVIHLFGNASEFLSDGSAIGGNFSSFPSKAMQPIELDKQSSPLVGFRVIKERVK